MKCKLFDVSCHALNWLLGLPWYVYALVGLAVVLLVWVLFDKIKGTILRIVKWGGWRAGVAAALGVIALIAAFWPRKRNAVSTEEQYPHPDFPPTKKKRRKTIFDGLGK